MDNEQEVSGVKVSQFPTASSVSQSDYLTGLNSGSNAKFSFSTILAWLQQQLPSGGGPEPATATPAMDGVGAVGSSTKYAREDHVHPADTNKQDKLVIIGLLKGEGAGGITGAVAGTDYQAPLTAGTDYATPAQLEGKANQAQLAYVETGTTASQNYTAGQYISLNGLLYTADTAIASGATFYTSGGNKNLTECPGGGFNNLFVTKTFTITVASIRQYNFIDGNYDVTLAGYTPIAVNTFDIDEDHCIIQKFGFMSNDINKLYYRIKNYDSSPVTNITFVVRVLYARAALIQL